MLYQALMFVSQVRFGIDIKKNVRRPFEQLVIDWAEVCQGRNDVAVLGSYIR